MMLLTQQSLMTLVAVHTSVRTICLGASGALTRNGLTTIDRYGGNSLTCETGRFAECPCHTRRPPCRNATSLSRELAAA